MWLLLLLLPLGLLGVASLYVFGMVDMVVLWRDDDTKMLNLDESLYKSHEKLTAQRCTRLMRKSHAYTNLMRNRNKEVQQKRLCATYSGSDS